MCERIRETFVLKKKKTIGVVLSLIASLLILGIVLSVVKGHGQAGWIQKMKVWQEYGLSISSQNELIENASRFAVEKYGDAFEDFTYETCMPQGSVHTVYFSKKYGTGGFITGETVAISISEDGSVKIAMERMDGFRGFDERLLKDISRKKLKSWVQDQLKEEYGARLKKYGIQEIQLRYRDAQYVLCVVVDVSFLDNRQTLFSQLDAYDYVLE